MADAIRRTWQALQVQRQQLLKLMGREPRACPRCHRYACVCGEPEFEAHWAWRHDPTGAMPAPEWYRRLLNQEPGLR